MILDRSAIVEGLVELVERAAAAGIAVKVHVLGGSAVALISTSRDRATNDIDSWVAVAPNDLEAFNTIVADISRRRGWPNDWINNAATQFLPDDGEPFDWRSIHTAGDAEVSVAPPELLLAMKLRSNRGHRDIVDLEPLIDAAGISNLEEVHAIFDRFFPNDSISPKCQAWLAANMAASSDDDDMAGIARATKHTAGRTQGNRVYVDTHLRAGQWVQGHWRKR